MQITAIGDVHGRNAWKNIRYSPADHIVFIGDYVDPHRPIPDYEVLLNFEEIIDFKKSDPERITLLLGNHDAQYLHYPLYSCSGHRADLQEILGNLFRKNEDLFQIAWQHNRHVFTHAGVSQGWYDSHQSTLNSFVGNSLAERLNEVHKSAFRAILFEVGQARGGGYAYGGPIWADQTETQFDSLADFYQVVGHSRVRDFEYYGDDTTSITYIDVGDTRVRFFTMIDDK